MTKKHTAVLKFGGTSLGTAELRRIAADKIREAKENGEAPVAVVSAMGRAPDPYATDSLFALCKANGDGASADMLLSCGEIISAAVFASELHDLGIRAAAFTGAQAGIITDESFGAAKILRVEPDAVEAAVEEDVVPVVAGFQGISERGRITTLGRGGTDLTAIALAYALQAQRVDIYTDVPGTHSGDPAYVRGAHSLDRVSWEEMAELSLHGAQVMNRSAAALAQRTRTPYGIRELRSGTGTIIEEPADTQKPVSGVTASGRMTWFRVIRGDVEERKRRMQVELEMFARLAEGEISIDQVTINQSGVAFAVAGNCGADVRQLLGDLNLAVRVREGCSKLSVVGAGMRGRPGVIHRIVRALSDADIEIIHCTDSHITVSVLVPFDDVRRAEQAVHDAFNLERA